MDALLCFSDSVYEKLSSMGFEPAVRPPEPAQACPLPRPAMRPALVPAELSAQAMIRGSYRIAQSWQLVEAKKSACAVRLLACSASLGVVPLGMLRSLDGRGIARDG